MYVYLYLSFYAYLYLSFYAYLYLSFYVYLIYLSIYIFIYLFAYIYLSFYTYLHLSYFFSLLSYLLLYLSIYIYQGMVQAAAYIYRKLMDENLLDRAFNWRPASGTQNFPLVSCISDYLWGWWESNVWKYLVYIKCWCA